MLNTLRGSKRFFEWRFSALHGMVIASIDFAFKGKSKAMRKK
jgi:hypothetical protein